MPRPSLSQKRERMRTRMKARIQENDKESGDEGEGSNAGDEGKKKGKGKAKPPKTTKRAVKEAAERICVPFLDLIVTFLRAIRVGVLHVRHTATSPTTAASGPPLTILLNPL
ncbi:hypothetical protein DFH06DRAFT_1123920 [Mycena polygramma]|nr:hypothetical protein DFH06DRAFT_1123920 [Mycena polygramma]